MIQCRGNESKVLRTDGVCTRRGLAQVSFVRSFKKIKLYSFHCVYSYSKNLTTVCYIKTSREKYSAYSFRMDT